MNLVEDINLTLNQDSSLKLNQERPKNTINTDTKCRIRTQAEMDYITVSVDEWDDLEQSINEVSIDKPSPIDFVSLFAGTGLTSLITMLSNIFKGEYSELIKDSICFIISLGLSLIAYFINTKKSGKHYYENETALKFIKTHLKRLRNKC